MRTAPVLAALGALLILLTHCGGVATEEVGRSIQQIVEGEASLAADGGDSLRGQVEAYYRERSFEPAWVTDEDKLRAAIEMLCRSERDGLNPRDYANASLQQLVNEAYGDDVPGDSARSQRLARLDVAVTHALMEYASDVLTGRVNPREVGSAWHTPVHKVDLLGILSDTTTTESLLRLSDRLATKHAQYGELRRALQRYREIAAAGGWPTVPAGEALSEGDSGDRVRALIRRLETTGDLDSTAVAGDSTYTYSTAVTEAVKSFQRRHGLEPDGAVGESVMAALNVPVEERVHQIEMNMERWRWIPSHFGSRYLYVNIPAFELHAFDDGKEALSMAVVVGEVYEDNATPIFSDTMEYVVFNPYWNVPESIARDEIVPKARADRSFLVENDYEIVSSWSENADVLNPMTADLGRVESGSYRIRQKPGSQNALGRIKFMFPNQFDIYLHDTPADYLFERSERAYSHGCIRVEKPIELAQFVFSGDQADRDRIEQKITGREQQSESLTNPLPVYILYWTAFVDENGHVNFREDIYGNDETLSRALARQSPDSERVPCDSLLSPIQS